MPRSVCILVLLLGFAVKAQALTYREFLNSWVGSWKGYNTVYGENDVPLEVLEVEQIYWWEGDVLRSVAQSWADNGRTRYQSHYIRLENGVLTNEVVYPNGIKLTYEGKIEEGRLCWYYERDGLFYRYQASAVREDTANGTLSEQSREVRYNDLTAMSRRVEGSLELKKESDVRVTRPRRSLDLSDLKK
ncbi:MAG: hypothetical protein JW739_03460 [Opitutales bacterium]|nr:hypothetical protein [Opitutales bacterium]